MQSQLISDFPRRRVEDLPGEKHVLFLNGGIGKVSRRRKVGYFHSKLLVSTFCCAKSALVVLKVTARHRPRCIFCPLRVIVSNSRPRIYGFLESVRNELDELIIDIHKSY